MKNSLKFFSLTAIIAISAFLLSFSITPESDNSDLSNQCCCKYKHQQSNPMAPYYYSWTDKKSCRTIGGTCTGSSREDCGN